jgi:hypothetical protein
MFILRRDSKTLDLNVFIIWKPNIMLDVLDNYVKIIYIIYHIYVYYTYSEFSQILSTLW